MPSMPPSALIEEVRFARDSPVERDGFEPSVPREEKLTRRDGGSGWRNTQTRTASKTFRGAAAVSYISARLKKAAPSVSPTPKF